MRNKEDDLKKLGGKAFHLSNFFLHKLESPKTSLKTGYDNGGTQLKSMFNDMDKEAVNKVLNTISLAFDYAALQPGYEDDQGNPIQAKASHKRGVNPFDSIK